MERMNVSDLAQRIATGSPLTLLDVREPWEYEICRIAGSINVPMSQIINRMDELDKDAHTIVICHHGARSWQAGSYLEGCGFRNIVNLDGGINAWSEQIDKQIPTY
jgi:rhodanese-related sulfurtransferase